MYKFVIALILIVGVFGQDNIPGLNMGLGAGYDIKLERVRMPLYQYTYSYGQQWKNPYTKVIWNVPDQIYLTEIPDGKIIKEAHTFSEFHEYITSVTTSWGIDVGLGYGGKPLIDFGFQRSHGHFDDLIKGGVNNIAIENRYNPFYQLDLWPDSEFNPHVMSLIAGLPNTISNEADQTKYNQFIESMGTHYVVSGQFGGFLNFTNTFQAALYSRHTQDWVAYQIKLSLTWEEIKVGIDWARNKSTDKLDKDYVENSVNTTECVGGMCAYIDEGDYDKWIASMLDEPGMLPAYKIIYPITELITGNAVKKLTLHDAVVKYIMSNTTTTD
jgi:hypothetical protein